MAARLFRMPTVTPLSWWRVDTAAGSSTPAAISTPDGSTRIQGSIRSDERGVLAVSAFRGPDAVTTLYLKRLSREVAGTPVAGTTITLDTGAVIPDPPLPAAPGGGLSLETATATFGPAVAADGWLKKQAQDPGDHLTGTITRNGNGAVTTASFLWDDGTTGVYTSTVFNATSLGKVDAWTVTYPGSPTKTVTQPTMTRDGNGAVLTRPALTVT